VLVLCLLYGAARSGPWLKAQGEGEVISGGEWVRRNAGFASGQSAQADEAFHAEYGAAPDVTLVLDSDMQRNMAAGETGTAFDNAWAGARTALKQWDHAVLSAELDGGVAGIRDAVSPTRISLQGTAQARLMFGQGFTLFGHHAFAGIETGYHWRAGPPADEVAIDAGAGLEPWHNGLLLLQSFSIIGVGPASGAYRRYDLLKGQIALAQGLTDRIWIEGGLIDTLAGAGAGEAGVVFALWWRF
jgi:hypothetical protein